MSKEKHIYTEEELDEVREWILEREDFKRIGTTGRNNKRNKIIGSAIITGFVSCFFLYAPVWVIFTLVNESTGGVFQYISLDNILSNSAGQAGFNPMAFLFSSFIVVLAIIGGASIVGWLCMLGASSNDDKWYENEIEKSEKMCEASLQEAEKPLKAEIDKLQNDLLDKETEYHNLLERYDKLDTRLKNNLSDYKREKKLWALEKKELQYQIKLKQGLVDELDESESPLGGLYD